ncbi:ANR50-like protein, partial [Mya arenaria]
MWANSFHDIIDVFVPSNWKTTPEITDVSCACNLWKNCKVFKLNDNTVSRIQDLRNKIYHDCSRTMEVSLDLKSEVFDAAFDLIYDADVQPFLDKAACKKKLEELQNGNTAFQDVIQHFKEEMNVLSKTQLELVANDNNIIQKIEHIEWEKNIKVTKKYARETLTLIKSNPMSVTTFILICALLMAVNKLYFQEQDQSHMESKQCVPEQYSYPFPQDLPLVGYLKQHTDLIGREWLFTEMESDILSLEHKRGVFVSAELGYGKSAIISHLLCAGEGTKGFVLNRKVVAFHVCKFNVESTRNPYRFIKRLVGSFATNNPEYGTKLAFLPSTSLIFNEDKCTVEIEACFDQAITHPLNEIGGKLETQIVVIDALDECYEKERNLILEITQTRIRLLPKWVKFIITSRNFTVPPAFHRYLKLYFLNYTDERNINDIERYLRYHEVNVNVSKHIKEGDSSFLYVVHALRFLAETNQTRIDKIPLSLEDIYEMNFERQFGQSGFQEVKPIFELVCASVTSLQLTDVFEILEFNNVSDKNTLNERYRKLTFFFWEIEGKVNFIHQSLYKWLISVENSFYKISLQSGHMMMARFLMNAT